MGYYVANEYEEEELRENPPEQPIVEKCVVGAPCVQRSPLTTDCAATSWQTSHA